MTFTFLIIVYSGCKGRSALQLAILTAVPSIHKPESHFD